MLVTFWLPEGKVGDEVISKNIKENKRHKFPVIK